MHNALAQVTLKTARHTLAGFSISGLATYLQVPDLDVVFDLGECPLSALPLRHVFLTHAHGDHSRCVLRHRALRGMLGLPGDAVIFLPEALRAPFLDVARAEAAFDGIDDADFVAPSLIGLSGDRVPVALPFRPELSVSAFPVDHRGVPSLGYTILERRKKLKAEHQGKSGPEIAALRRAGVDVADAHDVALITFIGDCSGNSLFEEDHIWRSAVVVVEATFVDPADVALARRKGHTHIDEIGAVLRSLGPDRLPEKVVLKHFSMKHTRAEIDDAVARAIPDFARERVALFL